jgi:phosphohistidine phosphatase SixA
MPRRIALSLSLLLVGWSLGQLSWQGCLPARAADPPPVSVAFIVRHAEKAAAPADDPGLTPAGAARSKRLAEVFKYARIDKLISSDKLRTRETLAPLAAQQGLAIADRVGDEAEVEASATGVAKFLKGYRPGTVSVIAHHSTTIGPILEELGISAAEAGSVNTGLHDNLLVVLLPEGRKPQLLKLRYP